MERPIFKPIGTALEQLDTPALVVDLDILEENLTTVHGFFQKQTAKLRPYVTTHRCPALAHRQLAAGGTVGGVVVTTLGEAEVFAEHGLRDILIANEIVTVAKIRRLCSLAHQVRLTVAVDSAANVQMLAEAASAYGVRLRVVVDIHTRLQRSGVAPGQPALALAQVVHAAPALELAGLLSYEGCIAAATLEELAVESRRCVQPVLDTRQLLERAGLAVQTVSVGSTCNYEIVGTMSGVTEVHAGAYALLDARYAPLRPQLRPAASVLTTVNSIPEDNTIITDAGQKAVSIDLGLPTIPALPRAQASSLSAEHCRVQLDNAARSVALGQRLQLLPRDIGTCANLYDYLHAVRAGRLEAVWRVAARGQYR